MSPLGAPTSRTRFFSIGSWLTAFAIFLVAAAACLVGMVLSPIVVTAVAGIVTLTLVVRVIMTRHQRARTPLHRLAASAGLLAVLIFYWISALIHLA